MPQKAFASNDFYWNDAYHGGSPMGVATSSQPGGLNVTDTTFSFGHSGLMGFIQNVSGDQIYVTAVNNGFLPGSYNFIDYLASSTPGEYAVTGVGDGYCFFYWDGTTVELEPNCAAPDVDTTTHIQSVSPYNGQIIASSSLPWPFNTTGYVNDTDWKEGARIRIKVDRNTDQQAVGAYLAFQSAFGNYTYEDITQAGIFNLSTTSINNTFGINRVGDYKVRWEIQTPGIGVHWWILNFNVNYNTLVSTSTSFTVGTSTAIDVITTKQTDFLNQLANSTGDQLATCQFSWFNTAVDFSLGSHLMQCFAGIMSYLFVPSPDQMSLTVQQIRSGILYNAPWGYATRFVDILQNTSTSTLPTFTAYVPISATASTSLTYDPGDMLDGAASLLDSINANGTDKNAKDIIAPMIQLFIAITVVLIIARDLMHMR